MAARVYFEVRPRYTAGSPGMVDEDTARRVAEEEKVAYQHYLQGTYGEADQRIAEKDGLGPLPLPNEPCFKCNVVYQKHAITQNIPPYIQRGLNHEFDGAARSIAEEVVEHTNHWLVRDLVTGEFYQRHFPSATLRGREASAGCSKCLAARERARAEQP